MPCYGVINKLKVNPELDIEIGYISQNLKNRRLKADSNTKSQSNNTLAFCKWFIAKPNFLIVFIIWMKLFSQ